MENGGRTAARAADGLTATSRIGFTDELRVGLRGTTRRVWGRRGVKVRQRLQLKDEWRYLVLAVDGVAGTIWGGWAATRKADALWPLVAGLRALDVLAALVWDNAPSHRDAEVREVGLPRVGLPPYRPELNPAERLFAELRRRIEGTVYATLDDKVAAVEAFLEELDADPPRVRRLCGWAWITAALEALPKPVQNAA